MAQNQIKWCSTYLLLIVKMLDTQSGNHLVLLFSSQSVAIEQILGTYDVLHDMLCGVAIIIEQRKWRFGYWSPHAAPSYLLIQQLWLSSQNYSSPLMVRRLCVCTKKGADGCCWLLFQQYNSACVQNFILYNSSSTCSTIPDRFREMSNGF